MERNDAEKTPRIRYLSRRRCSASWGRRRRPPSRAAAAASSPARGVDERLGGRDDGRFDDRRDNRGGRGDGLYYLRGQARADGGPYYVDTGLQRSDIREEREGIPLELTFNVSRIDAGDISTCGPLAGAVVDIWHCDALGEYSGVQDNAAGDFDTTEATFLRGYQLTDDNGVARFTTIYPGWYQGRAVHIHFTIRDSAESQQGYEFTSQLYFDDTLTDVTAGAVRREG